jgi:hypothetical protein
LLLATRKRVVERFGRKRKNPYKVRVYPVSGDPSAIRTPDTLIKNSPKGKHQRSIAKSLSVPPPPSPVSHLPSPPHEALQLAQRPQIILRVVNLPTRPATLNPLKKPSKKPTKKKTTEINLRFS